MPTTVKQRVQTFNARVPWPLRLVLIVFAGLILYRVSAQTLYTGWAAGMKLRDRASACTWPRILSAYSDLAQFNARYAAMTEAVSVRRQDPELEIELLDSPKGPFWIRRSGATRDGRSLLGYLLAEQDWIARQMSGHTVKAGDVVLDCGAHVGVFTRKALDLGAAQVVAIEPDPLNLECLRRNFQQELGSGRVALVEKGVWDSERTLTFFEGVENSGMGSLVHEQGGGKIEVPVTTIDRLVAGLGLTRVDYIKMDIEGAERNALQGAQETLRRFRPRVMLDSYHEPDDGKVLPAILRQAHPGYAELCGPCRPVDGMIVAHVTFFE